MGILRPSAQGIIPPRWIGWWGRLFGPIPRNLKLTASENSEKKGWLEDDSLTLEWPIFRCELLVSGRISSHLLDFALFVLMIKFWLSTSEIPYEKTSRFIEETPAFLVFDLSLTFFHRGQIAKKQSSNFISLQLFWPIAILCGLALRCGNFFGKHAAWQNLFKSSLEGIRCVAWARNDKRW